MGKAGLNNYRRPVQFVMDSTLKIHIAGTCERFNGTDASIVRINPNFWWNNSYSSREVLMFHELGHCVLNRGHTSTLDDYNDPVSVMHPTIISEERVYAGNYTSYMQELFRSTPDKLGRVQFMASYYWEHPYHKTSSADRLGEHPIDQSALSNLPPQVECHSH